MEGVKFSILNTRFKKNELKWNLEGIKSVQNLTPNPDLPENFEGRC